ncbi:DUF1631 domain-containing protein [Thioalkalivibrio thiocyanodenitrificans]|uniref:DUF1631 domain-containing protein n=1 Tax=Thioalkalivibrio thiocyanodenitrificans TaxID=243063 RepID=UPI00035C7AE8|nr:DUF1631 domain-containing protein [Thioalkalivibrio thiocyanodenitrificans]
MSDPGSENVVPFNGAARRESAGSALQIIGRCRTLTAHHVERCLKAMLDNTDDALFKRAEQAEDDETQSEYFEAMREVRRRRSTMESEYPLQLSRLFDAFLRGGAGRSAKAPGGELELSLVDDDELEENLALEGMISKANRVNESQLYVLTRRLAVALDRPKLAEDAHPLAPSALCEAFRSAVKALDVSLRIRLIIYKLFDKYVVGQLPELYKEVNHELAERGILPDLHARPAANPGQTARREGPETAQEELAPDPADGDEGGELLSLLQRLAGQSGGALQPGVTLVDRALVAGALRGLPAAAPASGGVYSGAELKDAVLSAVNGGVSTGVALNRTDETAIDIVAMLFDFIFDDPALPAPIKELIGRLQIPVLRVAIVDRSFFNRRKHPARRLINELARAGIGWTEEGEREDGLRSRIESLVTRLLEDSDGDVGLFERELLAFQEWSRDQAERAAQREERSTLLAQSKEHMRMAKAVAGEAIGRVVEDHLLPQPVLRLLRTTWQDLLVLIYLKEGQHGKLWKKALNVASLLVWSLLPKSTQAERDQLTNLLPSLLRALQEGMTRMSCSEDEQQAILAVLAAEHARLVRDPDIELDVDAGPLLKRPDAASARAVRADAAAGALPASASGTSQNLGAGIPRPALVPDAGPIADPSELQDSRSFIARKVAEINRLITEGSFHVYEDADADDGSVGVDEDAHLAQARNLEEGTWLELQDEEARPMRAKLSWKSLISGKYFFVNRHGLKVRELTVPALAAEFREGRANIIEDVPVFDRAISTLMASLSPSVK